jgi:plastocyanin
MFRSRIGWLAGIAMCTGLAFAGLASGHGNGAPATVVNVTAGKPSFFKFTLSKTSVPVGTVVFKVTSTGPLRHSFKVCSSSKGGNANSCNGIGTKTLNRGASTTLTITFRTKGSYEYLCTVVGHAAAGMKGILKVT